MFPDLACPICWGASVRVDGGRVTWCCPSCYEGADVDDPLPPVTLPLHGPRSTLIARLATDRTLLRRQLEATQQVLTDADRLVARLTALNDQYVALHADYEHLLFVVRDEVAAARDRGEAAGAVPDADCTCTICRLERAAAWFRPL